MRQEIRVRVKLGTILEPKRQANQGPLVGYRSPPRNIDPLIKLYAFYLINLN